MILNLNSFTNEVLLIIHLPFVFIDLSSGCFGLGADWLTQPIPLPSPEEDCNSVFSPQQQQSPYSAVTTPQRFPGLLTPDSSMPSSPQSGYYSDDPEINNVMSSLLDNDIHQYSPHEVLPIWSLPTPQPLNISSAAANSGSTESIRDLLLKREDEPSSPPSCAHLDLNSRKRKSAEDKPPSKRRLSQVAKKERKREQNKTAALKYRQRKRGEKSDVDMRRCDLEERNGELKVKVEALTNEIQYLTKLWREVEARKQQLGHRI